MSDTTWVALARFGGSAVVGVVAVLTTQSVQSSENDRERQEYLQRINLEKAGLLRVLMSN
jgi:adenosine/AMP kinase